MDLEESSLKKKKSNQLSLIDDLRNYFECPICYGSMIEDIYTCSNGHPICKQCSKKIIQCPNCRNKNIRIDHGLNRLASSIESTQLFKCPYQNCNQFFTKNQLKEHLTECSKIPYYNPLNFQECYYDLEEYFKFIREKSPFIFHSLTDLSQISNFNFQPPNYLKMERIYHLFHCPNQNLIIYLIGDIDYQSMNYTLVYQGIKTNQKFNLEANFTIYLPSKEIYKNLPTKGMALKKISFSHQIVNLVDLIPEDSLAICTLGRTILDPFYKISTKLKLKINFRIREDSYIQLDDQDYNLDNLSNIGHEPLSIGNVD